MLERLSVLDCCGIGVGLSSYMNALKDFSSLWFVRSASAASVRATTDGHSLPVCAGRDQILSAGCCAPAPFHQYSS